MKEQYEVNPWGWDPKMKRAELAHDEARFVVSGMMIGWSRSRTSASNRRRRRARAGGSTCASCRSRRRVGDRASGGASWACSVVGAKLELDCVLDGLRVQQGRIGLLRGEAQVRFG